MPVRSITFRAMFADVVWHGLSTAHVRAGFADHLTLDELRTYWAPISPFPFMPRVATMGHRPMRFIVARYDLTFPIDFSHDAIAEARRHNLPLDIVWLPCGHYTTGELPWKAIDAWKIATFFRKQFKRLVRSTDLTFVIRGFLQEILNAIVVKCVDDDLAHFASGKIGSISTGTFFNLSSACFIGGRITAYLSSIAFALS